MPLMIQAFGYNKNPLSTLEVLGWILWFSSFVFEHIADRQKKQFVKDCAQKKIKGKAF